MSLGILTGKPHDIKIEPNYGESEMYYIPKNERIPLPKKEKTLDLNLPKSHQEISQVLNPLLDASHILSELLLKHYINPQDKRNVLMKRMHSILVDLRYMLDEDLHKESKELSCSAVYHPLEM